MTLAKMDCSIYCISRCAVDSNDLQRDLQVFIAPFKVLLKNISMYYKRESNNTFSFRFLFFIAEKCHIVLLQV